MKKFDILFNKLLQESVGYTTTYMGNCVNLEKQLEAIGEDPNDAAMIMVDWFSDEENGTNVPKELFLKYVNLKNLPRNAKILPNTEYCYFNNPINHPNGSVNFMLYTLDTSGNDIHYFFSVYPHPKLNVDITRGYAFTNNS
jgi:hypothetical protein